MKLEAWSGSNTGLVRQANEDSVGCFPELQLAVVADGMGGHKAGKTASRLAVEVVHDVIDSACHPAAPWWRAWLSRANANHDHAGRQLGDAVGRANRKIYDVGKAQRDDGKPMGTTVVALFCALAERKAYWAHVGDSRLYRWRAGELELLTADHTNIGEPYWRAAKIPIDLGHTNFLARALGMQPDVDVSTGSSELRGGDLYFMCSDGVSGLVPAPILRETLAAITDLARGGEALIQHALDAGGRDNASVVLLRVTDD